MEFTVKVENRLTAFSLTSYIFLGFELGQLQQSGLWITCVLLKFKAYFMHRLRTSNLQVHIHVYRVIHRL